jgi:hypothetical protein
VPTAPDDDVHVNLVEGGQRDEILLEQR